MNDAKIYSLHAIRKIFMVFSNLLNKGYMSYPQVTSLQNVFSLQISMHLIAKASPLASMPTVTTR